jgi:mannose-6-phosphate isomerase-like protein (cupin superfamily)
VESKVLVVGPGEGTQIPHGPLIRAFGEHSDGWALLEGTLPPGVDGPPRHVHAKHSEGFYVVSGMLTVLVDDVEVSVAAGGYAFVPPGIPHTFSNRADEAVHFLGISTPGIERMLLEMSEVPASDGRPDIERIAEIAARYDSEFA